MPPLALMLSIVSSLLLSMCRVNALEISTLSDFIDFTNNVNNGINSYTGETVLLTDDLDMSGYLSSFVPVGKSNTNTFLGTFDGQGHVISSLVVSSSEFRFLGIFGVSYSTTIKNLVVDKSCSFKSNYTNSTVSVATGGILGQCYSYYEKCIVEGCVNMAQITYSGVNAECTYLGGVVGKFTPVSYDTSITNCVNYGNVSSVSSSSNMTRIGGIAGEVWTWYSIGITNTIKGCVNFGALYQSGEVTHTLYIGGISSVDRPNIVYEGCVSLGNISYNESIPIDNVSVGSISGRSNGTTFTNCFWEDSLGLDATGSLSENITTEGTVESFTTSPFTNTVLLQILATRTSTSFSIINFDSRGGSDVGPVILFLSAVTGGIELTLPTPEKEENIFRGWYSDEELTEEFDASGLSAGNTTVYAKWDVNKYAVTFTVDGEVYNESSQEYGAAIAIPPTDPTKDGFTFDGWYNDAAFTNKTNTDLTVTEDLTLYGRFIFTTIKVEFSTKDLSTEEMVKEIEKVAGCTDCFTIVRAESDGKGTSSIIIKFSGANDAANFMRTLEGDSQAGKNPIIRSAQMVSENVYTDDTGSFSPLPTTLPPLFIQLFL